MKRDTDTDLIRVLACFLVVVIHCCYPMNGFNWLYRGLAVVAVPLFVMISGHYMLAEDQPLSKIIKKTGRLFLVMLGWSAAYFLYELAVLHTHTFSGISDLLGYLLTQPNHLWYLYAVMALYLLTPALRVFAAHASKKEYCYAFLLGSVLFVLLRSGAFPVLETVADRMKVSYPCGFIFCYLFGDFYRRFGIKKPGFLYLFGAFGAATTVAAAFLVPAEYKELAVSFFAPGVLLAAMGLYLFLRELYRRHPFQSRFLSGLAKCTLGIYLLHPAVILFLQEIVGDAETACYMVPLRALPVFAFCALPVFLFLKLTSRK